MHFFDGTGNTWILDKEPDGESGRGVFRTPSMTGGHAV